MIIAPYKSNYIKLLIGVAAISFSPLAVKFVSFSTSVSAFYRSFYAACFFLIISLFKFKYACSKNNFQWLAPSIIAGLFLGIDFEVWHKTIIYLGAGAATFLGNSQIIFITLFAAFIFKEKIPIVFYVTVAMVMAGLYMLTPSVKSTVNQSTGYILGLIVGFTYAGMLISLRYAKSRSAGMYPELFSLSIVFGVAALVIALYSTIIEHTSLLVWDGRSHAIMLITAFMCQTFGWYLINNSITEIPAHEGSLLLMLQPLLAIVWGYVFFSEKLCAIQAFGIILTPIGMTIYQLRYFLKNFSKQLFGK